MSGTSAGDARRDRQPTGRRHAIRDTPGLNGVDGVEVSDDGTTLTVYFLGKAPYGIGPENVRVDGGRRIGDIRAVDVETEREDDPELDDRMLVTVDRSGDTSRYRLSLVTADPHGRPGTEPYPGFDQRYHGADFTFLPDCPTAFDCRCAGRCGGSGDRAGTGGGASDHARGAGLPGSTDAVPAPVIDYTARDFDTFRQLIMDRMALTTPDWRERHAPDLGVTLTEILASAADRVSYHQDAVGTEAYLDTARRRVSVRRHVRLIDYPMHDGCAARAVVALEVVRAVSLPAGTFRFAAVDVRRLGSGAGDRSMPGPVLDDADLDVWDEHGAVEVFEPVGGAPLHLRPAHNSIALWTWGGERCVLPRGATSATLRDAWVGAADGADDGGTSGDEAARAAPDTAPGADRDTAPDTAPGADRDTAPGAAPGADRDTERGAEPAVRRRALHLRPGDLLLFEEVRGPRSGTPGDADPAHRQVVRLTTVTPTEDRLYGQPVLEVTWAAEDALTFPVCLTTRGGQDRTPVADVSVARGNLQLTDHGRTLDFCPTSDSTPEEVTVPPEPAVLPDYGTPAFGCGDTGAGGGNAPARLIGALLARTGDGHALTTADVHQLTRLTGLDAVTRAGIGLERTGRRRRERVVPGTAPAQAEALRTLLAQSVYPGIREEFSPRPAHPVPVAQTVPYPDPRHVSAAQAGRLADLPDRMRNRLAELWREARDNEGLTEAQISELTTLFGQRAVNRVQPRRRPLPALRELLHHSDRLLAAKLRRVADLTDRARAGTVLDARTAWEIARSWGPRYAESLHPDDAALHGPVAALAPEPRLALPAVRLSEQPPDDGADGRGRRPGAAKGTARRRRDADSGEPAGPSWEPRRDLLRSGPRDRHLVGELEDDGRLALRFGDGRYGARPEPGTRLRLRYRVGSGPDGNVGSGAIAHLVLGGAAREITGRASPVAAVRNPLPAVGGAAPEPVDQVRRLAPLDLRRTRLRAVTADDYAELARAVPGVRRAAAALRWTGGHQEAQVAIDAHGAPPGRPPRLLLDRVRGALEPLRRIGHDLVIVPARTVPLDVALRVCAAPGHQEGQILADVYRVLGTGPLSDGALGFFHPDRRGFGEPVRVSRLVATVAAVPGVAAVTVTHLHRLFHTPRGELEDGVLTLGSLEIAQCDNDPDRPEHGRLTVETARDGGARW